MSERQRDRLAGDGMWCGWAERRAAEEFVEVTRGVLARRSSREKTKVAGKSARGRLELQTVPAMSVLVSLSLSILPFGFLIDGRYTPFRKSRTTQA